MSTNEPSDDGAGRTTANGNYPADIDERERYVLYCLSKHGRMALWDLADEVTVWEVGRRLPEVAAETGRKTYLSLYHTHVPRLERAELVVYDPDRDLVALSDAALGIACCKPARPDHAHNHVSLPDDR